MLIFMYFVGARYLAILCASVYIGAVLIFFVFIVFTLPSGQRWFTRQSRFPSEQFIIQVIIASYFTMTAIERLFPAFPARSS